MYRCVLRRAVLKKSVNYFGADMKHALFSASFSSRAAQYFLTGFSEQVSLVIPSVLSRREKHFSGALFFKPDTKCNN
jgi:hypothetical protein